MKTDNKWEKSGSVKIDLGQYVDKQNEICSLSFSQPKKIKEAKLMVSLTVLKINKDESAEERKQNI